MDTLLVLQDFSPTPPKLKPRISPYRWEILGQHWLVLTTPAQGGPRKRQVFVVPGITFADAKIKQVTDPTGNVNLSPFQQWESAYECLQNDSMEPPISAMPEGDSRAQLQ
ncbi:hypothetical protein V6N13_063267 [Hibiscus sabdariffa]|uniref:Uncharacterized protein n=1 Tax=Hibiscus sabdariffa TaxID=183260 RepID=A0ABR2C6H4_9ROSI